MGKSISYVKILLIIVMLVPCLGEAVAQGLNSNGWSDGSVTLASGEIIVGKVLYDVASKTVSIQQEDETRSLKASKVLEFFFYDLTTGRKRLFISVAMEIPNKAALRMEFLEVIKDLRTYIILAQLTTRVVVVPAHRYSPSTKISQQVNNWYVIDADGGKRLYFSFMERPLLGLKLEFYNAGIFKELASPLYREVMEYAKANAMNPEHPNDNLGLLEYKMQLTSVDSEISQSLKK